MPLACLFLVAAALVFGGCAKSVDKAAMRAGVSQQTQGEQTGVYQASLKSKKDVLVKFSFDLKSSELKIVDVMQQSFPKQNELVEVYRQNAQAFKDKGVMIDYLLIKRDGSYHCLNCGKLTGTDMVSVYFGAEINNPVGSVLGTALLPLTVLSSTGKKGKRHADVAYSHHVVERDRINMIGQAVDRLLTRKLREDAMRLAESRPEGIKEFYEHYPQYEKGPVLEKLRALGGFERLHSAYLLSGAKSDFNAMAQAASTREEKARLEVAALNIVQDKTRIFDLSISPSKGQKESYEGSAGLFKVKAFQTTQSMVVNVGVRVKSQSVMPIKYNALNVKVKVSCSVERSCVLRSNVLGNRDYEDTATRSNTVTLRIRPGALSDSGTVTISDIPLSYTDVGLMGGTTRCQATGDVRFEAEIVDVSPVL
ncbi:hypothetical protein [Fundidesulfovibrio butyratiphilus]